VGTDDKLAILLAEGDACYVEHLAEQAGAVADVRTAPSSPPAAVRLLRPPHGQQVAIGELERSLGRERAQRERPRLAKPTCRGALTDPLQSVPPPVYVERLTGQRVGRSGKIRCPFQDRTPSLHVYDEPERGWYCFGCGRGGDVYTLGSLLLGIGTRGSDFQTLRRRVAQELLKWAGPRE
jgi:hypothetical protein